MADQTRKNNIGFNLYQILTKYTAAGSFLRGMTDILRRLNMGHGGSKSSLASPFKEDKDLIDSAKRNIQSDRYNRFEKQVIMNSRVPTKSGVISSPDPREQSDIQSLNRSG